MRAAALLPALLVLASGCLLPPGMLRPGAPGGPGGEGGPDAVPDGTVTIPRKFVHEHAAFAVFIEGERVNFTHPDYDLRARGNISAHLHVEERRGGEIIHIEGHFPEALPDVTLAAFLAIHGVVYANGTLTLDTFDAHNGTTWRDAPPKAWQGWVQRAGRDWERVEGPGWFLRDGQRVLLTYGELGEQELRAQQEAVATPPGLVRGPAQA